MLTPARAGRVKAGRFSAATVRPGLYTTEHDGTLVRSGLMTSSILFCLAQDLSALPGAAFSSRSSRTRRTMAFEGSTPQ
jgi:hypothetical protein